MLLRIFTLRCCLFLSLCLLTLPGFCQSPAASSGTSPAAGTTRNENEELQKFALETRKFEFEQQNERFKVSVIAGTILIPLLVFLALLRAQWNRSFELKAAEIVINGGSAQTASRRAATLKSLFPRRLSRHFVGQFAPEDDNGMGAPRIERVELLKLLAEHPEREAEIRNLFARLFPEHAASVRNAPDVETWTFAHRADAGPTDDAASGETTESPAKEERASGEENPA